jgi:hypothetical protein
MPKLKQFEFACPQQLHYFAIDARGKRIKFSVGGLFNLNLKVIFAVWPNKLFLQRIPIITNSLISDPGIIHSESVALHSSTRQHDERDKKVNFR